MFLFYIFLVFTGFLQACSVFIIRFDDKNLPYLLKASSTDTGILESPGCSREEVFEMLSQSNIELSKTFSMYRMNGIDAVIILESEAPLLDQVSKWVRLPAGNEEAEFDEVANLVSMLIGLDSSSLDVIIGKSTNISPVDKTPFFYTADEQLPRITGIVNVDQVTCYITTALHCLYQIPVFRERLHAIAIDLPKGTINIVSLLDLVFYEMAKGIVPDGKLMRLVANALADDHPILRNREKKLTIAESYEGVKFILASLRKCLNGNLLIESPFDDLFRLRTNDVFSDLPGFALYDFYEHLEQGKLDMNALVLSQIQNVEHLPPYLFVSMPRFTGERIETPLDFPVDSWTLVGPRLDPHTNYTYELAAIVIHVRSKIAKNNGGHYVIVVKQGDHWVFLNDDKKPIRIDFEAEKKLLQTEGNLFMYKRQGVELLGLKVPWETEKFSLEPIVLRVPEDDDFPYHLLESGDMQPMKEDKLADDFPSEFLDPNYEGPVMDVVDKKVIDGKEEKEPLKEKQPQKSIKTNVSATKMRTTKKKPIQESPMISEPVKTDRKDLVVFGEQKSSSSEGSHEVTTTRSDSLIQTISENAVNIAAALFLGAAAGYYLRNQ